MPRHRSPSPAASAGPHPQPALLSGAAVNARPAALVFRVLAAVLILTGILRYAGIAFGDPDASTLLFYTMLSNLLCLGWMLLLIVRTARDLRHDGPRGTSTAGARWGGAVMMAITVTMLIYLIVLVPTRVDAGDSDIFSLTDNLIHIVTPCLLIVDWLLFVAKGSFRWFDPLLWTLIPYAYLTFAFVYGGLGGEFTPGEKYPYPFMNLETLGLDGVTLWIVALTAALVAVGFVYVAVDRALGTIVHRTASRHQVAPSSSR
ncbi:Pr6Pr family membrane protein [Microbacterium sp. 179-I 3D3 NHS]|uniref:Pr6Pr family membrane protein n=1 Tax=Microbacterium sp. 179-I 3D3 NHS TaxID=3142382 RepID=UPI0039A3CA33